MKFQGLEFFGIFEKTSNGDSEVGGDFTQLGAEAIYRFGSSENVFLAGRYNSISGKRSSAAGTQDINRINIGGGWYMTKNVMAKLEYVTSKYDGDGYAGSKYQGAEFNGIVFEAVIGF